MPSQRNISRRSCRMMLGSTSGISFVLGVCAVFSQSNGRVPTLAMPPASPYAPADVTFEDVTASSGLGRFRHVAGSPSKPYLPDTTGSGVAIFDYDNDGWPDIYLVNALSHAARRGEILPERAALFRNNHDGTFTDVTARAGLANERWGAGVCVGDFDNDGWEDLYVTNLGVSRLYHNNADGTFTDVAEKAGVAVHTWATGCSFGDYNSDGRLDLYVAGYVDFDWNHPPPPGQLDFAPVPLNPQTHGPRGQRQLIGLGAAYDPGMPYCTFLGTRVACGPLGLRGAPDFLFRNNGDGTFRDMTREAKVEDRAGFYGFSVAWADLDDDGRPDIVVANDSTPNFVYHNRGDGTFEEIGRVCGLGTNADGRAQANMGMAVGDYDHDGRDDLFFTTFSHDSYTLQHNNGGLDFMEMSQQGGLSEITFPFLGWGAEFLDYDNDGWLDILTANGHIYPQADGSSWNTSYRQRPLLFRNCRNGRFADVSGNLGAGFCRPRSSRGSAVGDLFNDGSLDLVFNVIDDQPALLRNRGGNRARHWITFKLTGDPARRTPRDAIGAIVFCTAGGFRQRGEVASGRSYLSQDDLRIHFGLGRAERVDRLEVLWPGGFHETIRVPGVDRLFHILEGKGIQSGGGVAK